MAPEDAQAPVRGALGRSAQDRRIALDFGAEAEAAAAAYLFREGWEILARNWRGTRGELDIVARRDSALRFVEVKARSKDDPRNEEVVSSGKQHLLRLAAEEWLDRYRGPLQEACFLVVFVDFQTRPWAFSLLDDAF